MPAKWCQCNILPSSGVLSGGKLAGIVLVSMNAQQRTQEDLMSLLPLMEKGKPMAGHADWPLFYMNDFSRLGIVVTGPKAPAA